MKMVDKDLYSSFLMQLVAYVESFGDGQGRPNSIVGVVNKEEDLIKYEEVSTNFLDLRDQLLRSRERWNHKIHLNKLIQKMKNTRCPPLSTN